MLLQDSGLGVYITPEAPNDGNLLEDISFAVLIWIDSL